MTEKTNRNTTRCSDRQKNRKPIGESISREFTSTLCGSSCKFSLFCLILSSFLVQLFLGTRNYGGIQECVNRILFRCISTRDRCCQILMFIFPYQDRGEVGGSSFSPNMEQSGACYTMLLQLVCSFQGDALKIHPRYGVRVDFIVFNMKQLKPVNEDILRPPPHYLLHEFVYYCKCKRHIA